MKNKNNKKRFAFKKPWALYFIPFSIVAFAILIGLGWLENKYGFLP